MIVFFAGYGTFDLTVLGVVGPMTLFVGSVFARSFSTPHEVLVKGVLMHRWAERDGTCDDLVAQHSQARAMLPGREG